MCSHCYRDSSQVKLLDAIDNTKMVKICEECAILDDIPVIRKPSSLQLNPSKKPATVFQRLSKMTGYKPEVKEQEKVEQVMKKIIKAEPSQLSIKQRQALASQANKPLNLVDNFHWHIQMARRKRKISQAQLANSLGEQEETIKIIESGKLPDDAARIINKIEQYLGLHLAKSEYEAEQTRLSSVKQPSRVISFDKKSLQTLTISDLVKMKKQKEQAEQGSKEAQSEKEETIIASQKDAEQNMKSGEDKQLTENEDLLGDDIEFLDDE